MTSTLPAVDAAHTGIMHTLDRTGDTRTMWDKSNPDEVKIAQRTFKEFKDKGYQAFRAEGKKGEKGEQIRNFDPDAERIIFVKPLVGG